VNGQLVVVWADDRSGNGVFAQNLLGDGTTGIATALDEVAAAVGDVRLLLNPSEHPTLIFDRTASGPCTITLLDARGGTARTERIRVSEGTRVALRAEGLALGLYVIRMDGPSGIRTMRWAKE
jgi:hypothetical protein